MLAYADFSLRVILEIDVSHGGLGVVFSEAQAGKVRPIIYANRCLVLTDVFSKYTGAVPTRHQCAATVARVSLSEWFYKFGVPAHLHSDQAGILKALSSSSYVTCMGL